MERLADKTVEELKQIREEYVKKYIGDFDKPINYARTLLHLDRLIHNVSAMSSGGSITTNF